MAPDLLHSLLVDMAACLQVELENDDAPVCWVGVAPGDGVVLDNAGCKNGKCGQAWVRLGIGYPASRTGIQDTSLNNCSKPLGLDVEVGVMRCFDVSERTGGPKDPDSVAARETADMMAMRRAVNCCANNVDTDLILGQYRPAPINGGLAGGFWLVHVGTML